MQNVPDECDMTIELPALREVSIHYLGDCDDVVNVMLARATRLESFDSYKLWCASRSSAFLAHTPTLWLPSWDGRPQHLLPFASGRVGELHFASNALREVDLP